MTIEIRDVVITSSGSPVLIDLRRLLDTLAPEATQMQWSVLSLEATTTLASGINMLELEAEIARRGKHVDYVGLYNLAFRLSQIINGTFCGCYSARCTPSGLQDEDLKRSCDVALLCEDSSVWIVHAREGSLIKRLRSLFTDTRVVD